MGKYTYLQNEYIRHDVTNKSRATKNILKDSYNKLYRNFEIISYIVILKFVVPLKMFYRRPTCRFH